MSQIFALETRDLEPEEVVRLRYDRVARLSLPPFRRTSLNFAAASLMSEKESEKA
jgi:hypothetical protein